LSQVLATNLTVDKWRAALATKDNRQRKFLSPLLALSVPGGAEDGLVKAILAPGLVDGGSMTVIVHSSPSRTSN
jgi:hypothetical protein